MPSVEPTHVDGQKADCGLRDSVQSSSVLSGIARLEALFQRLPWLVPIASFALGWAGFLMVKRGEELARTTALIALAGWIWLLVEPLVRHYLERRRQGVGKFVANFFSQSIEQEILFFCLPFIIGATQSDVGHIVFTSIAVVAALLSTIDPIYERYIAARAATRLMFHAYCSVIAAITVLPMTVHLSLERSWPLAVIGVGGWLLLTLPMSLKSLHTPTKKVIWIACLLAAPVALWLLRSHVPAVGLAVTQAQVTQSVNELTPGPPVTRLTTQDLAQGVIAFVAIRAPMGVAQTVIFEWRFGNELECISADIVGGRKEGFRVYARKQLFPEQSRGVWKVDVVTPQGQLLKRLSFVVE